MNLFIIIKTSSLPAVIKHSSTSNQHRSQTLINVNLSFKTRICANTPPQVRAAYTPRCTSPGWTPSLHLLRLLSPLRFRAPAASSGSGPAGKPALPATPAPPRSPPASGRDASFSGQLKPAVAPATLAAARQTHITPGSARKPAHERVLWRCG